MKWTTLIFVICCLAICLPLQSQTLHTLLIADTQDDVAEFAESCRADFVNMKREFTAMANAVGYSSNLIEIKDQNFTSEKLKAAINTLTVKPEDVVFIYYAGAGFCDADRPEDERALYMGADNKDIISTAEVVRLIESKNARLNVLLVDACALIREVAFISKRGEAPNKVYQSLLSACGTVKVFSSKCSQYSFGDKNGGIFTNAYIGAIQHYIELGTQNVNWKNLLEYAAKGTVQKAMSIFRNQHPAFFFSEDFVDQCAS